MENEVLEVGDIKQDSTATLSFPDEPVVIVNAYDIAALDFEEPKVDDKVQAMQNPSPLQ